jgi:hypothetical protein
MEDNYADDMHSDMTEAYDEHEEPEMVECEHCGKMTSASNVGGASVGGGASAGGGG